MTRHYTRPDGVSAVALVSLALTVWADGGVTGSFAAWNPRGERIKVHLIPEFHVDGKIAPPGIEALQVGGQMALDLWAAGAVGS